MQTKKYIYIAVIFIVLLISSYGAGYYLYPQPARMAYVDNSELMKSIDETVDRILEQNKKLEFLLDSLGKIDEKN